MIKGMSSQPIESQGGDYQNAIFDQVNSYSTLEYFELFTFHNKLSIYLIMQVKSDFK